MPETAFDDVLKKLDQLRLELIELAYTLECRGRFDAADVAMTTSVRVGELSDEAAAVRPSGPCTG